MSEQEKLSKEKQDSKQKRFIEDLVNEVQSDFAKRRKERISYERQWQLNMNFLAGNQYCKINARGDIDEDGSEFYWQNREVFNHIAPLIETRLAKFSKINPKIYVRPKSDNDLDLEGAKIAEKLISETFINDDFTKTVSKVNVWSETCGSGFYKIIWNNDSGEKMGVIDGKDVFSGGVEILPISPFEIFPDNLFVEEIDELKSLIHARAVSVKEVKEKYGVDVAGSKIGVFNLNKSGTGFEKEKIQSTVDDSVIVIEKYEKPTKEFPKGRLITVADDKLLYYGELPYINGEGNKRSFPFVKQDSISVAGSFFATSIIERLIPLQRSYNAVKNRKHEFLNRLSMGILSVEDGSVDVENLEQEGLSPGKILVYRQGSKAPEIMSDMSVPVEFSEEENKLLNEFVSVSGVSDVSTSSNNASLSSGSALQILIEQDNERLLMPASNIRRSYVDISKHVIRLFSQFLSGVRVVKFYDAFNKSRICYATRESVRSDDTYTDYGIEFLLSETQKKDLVYKLLESGLLQDESGRVRPYIKSKILQTLGYEELDYLKGMSRLHEEKAQMENEKMRNLDVQIEEIDDDEIHVDEHVKYVLSEYAELSDNVKERYFNHIKAHKERKKTIKTKEN